MDYFKWEMWRGGDMDTVFSRMDEWDEACKAYLKQLGSLEPELSKRNWHFFSAVSLHDGYVLSVEIGDFLDQELSKLGQFQGCEGETKVRMKVFLGSRLCQMEYSRGRRINLKHDGLSDCHPGLVNQMQYLGYDELSMVDQGYFRHQLLFSSGAELAIEFKSFKYRMRRTERAMGWSVLMTSK